MQMTDLTLSLIAVGAVILAALLAHNAWQGRRERPRRADPPASRHPHAVEPNLEGQQRHSFNNPVRVDPPAEAMMIAAGATASAAPSDEVGDAPLSDGGTAPPARVRYVPRIDALIDAIVPIALDASLTGEALVPHLPVTRRAGSKPFLVEGFNPATGDWEHPVAGARYSELQVGLQLANRSGALNEIEYSEFVQKIEAFAQSVGGMADLPDMMEMVSRARELDGFAGQHDAQLAVHLRARTTAWSVGYIQQHAARHGFVSVLLSGRMVLPGQEEGAPPMLTLQFDPQAALAEDPNQAALRSVTLNFDVPQTDRAQAPFDLWQERARALALSMEAFVVDDNGQTLSPEGFATIGKELEWLYQALDKRGVPAGSMAARRLFS